jgi:hypothetical protein
MAIKPGTLCQFENFPLIINDRKEVPLIYIKTQDDEFHVTLTKNHDYCLLLEYTADNNSFGVQNSSKILLENKIAFIRTEFLKPIVPMQAVGDFAPEVQ